MPRTPRFEKPKRGAAWPPAVKALVIVTLEEADGNLAAGVELLKTRARWPGGLPSTRSLRAWAKEAGLDLATGDPDKTAQTQAARAARFARLEDHRLDLSEKIGARILPLTADLIVARLEEQGEVEQRVREARERLTEALVMQRAADGADSDSIKAARREVVLARLMLEVEQDSRLPFRDLIRLTTVGIVQHLNLEGLVEEDDDESNPIIVELHIPRPDPSVVEATVIPQHALPERTD
jgi:hypothetical protein